MTFPEFVMEANERAKIRITKFLHTGSTEPPPLPAKALHFTVSCLVLEEFSPSLFFLLLSDLPKTGIFIKILSPTDLVGINHFQIYHKEQAMDRLGQTWTDRHGQTMPPKRDRG